MTKKAVITGSFNPVTSGHLFLLEQAQKLFDEVYMVILINPEKTYKLSLEKRLSLLKEAVKPYDNVKIFAYDGFACDFCLSVGANLMLRGVRNDKEKKTKNRKKRKHPNTLKSGWYHGRFGFRPYGFAKEAGEESCFLFFAHRPQNAKKKGIYPL